MVRVRDSVWCSVKLRFHITVWNTVMVWNKSWKVFRTLILEWLGLRLRIRVNVKVKDKVKDYCFRQSKIRNDKCIQFTTLFLCPKKRNIVKQEWHNIIYNKKNILKLQRINVRIITTSHDHIFWLCGMEYPDIAEREKNKTFYVETYITIICAKCWV